MNCSDSTPGPVIVKYEDDAPQISGKPCIDFQPDDRWQIKDDDEDCNVDAPGKKTVVNDTRKNKDHSDEKRLDSAVNGDSDKIDSVVKVKHEESVPNDSCVEFKECPVLENDSKSDVDQQNKEKSTESLASTKIKLESEEMRNISPCPIKIEHSDDGSVNEKNEKSSPSGDNETENAISVDERDKILQGGEKSDLSLAESSVCNEKEKSSMTQDNQQPQGDSSCTSNVKINSDSAEEALNGKSDGSACVPSIKTENETNSSAKVSAEESPPKLENHSSSEEPVQADQDMPDISGSNSTAEAKTSSSAENKTSSSAEDKTSSSAEDKTSSSAEDKISSSAEDKTSSSAEDKTSSSAEDKTSSSAEDKTSSSAEDKTSSRAEAETSSRAEAEASSSAEAETNSSAEAKTSSSAEAKTSSSAEAKTSSSAVAETSSKSDCVLIGESSKASRKSVEAESEVQVISCSAGCKDVSKEQNKSQERLPHDVVLLNSLKGVLKAGQYKPVKFPHTGALGLAENEVIIESPSLLVPLLIKEADVFPRADEGKTKTEETAKKPAKPPVSKNFFESSVGKFLISLGMGRVEEWYHRDMKKSKLKQIKKYGPDEKVEEEFHKHQKEYLKAREANSVFSFRLRRCQFCDFKSESISVMEAHYLIPHLSPRKEYKCNFCVFLTRDPKEIIFHFEALHGKKAVLDFIMPFHECPFCCFQSHLKTKVNAHINRCRKHFMPTHNQAPPFDFEFPGVTTKPVTMADILAHRAIMNAAKNRPNQPIYAPPNAVPKGITVRNKLALLNKLSNQNSVNNVQGSTLVKQLVGQQPKPIQPVGAATSIHLPPGLVITRPRANLTQVQNTVRLTAPRITPAVRHQVNTRKWVYNSTESQLASSGISITPVTKVASQGVWTPNLNNAARPTMKNITVTPISSSSNQVVSQKPGPPQPVALFTNVAGNDSRNGNRGPVIMSVQSQATTARLPIGSGSKIGSPRIHIPYQRLNTPPSQVVKGSSGNTFVMCEICDSYIKDLEELRTHMNWVHKVKIHPKMLVSRPPLNCQKCQWRFFTDQGLERHLLGAHGLVTTNMQEMANKNQDGGRCIICGAVFTYKLVSHMTQVHKVTLKPAHLSYKCTVCTATFTLYRLFESHVYNVHSGSAKRPAEEPPASEPPSKRANITVVTPAEPKEEVQEVVLEKCKECDSEVEDLEKHLIKKHLKKCSVKLCHIEKCEKCLYSTDEILVIRMSDFGIEDDDDDEDSDEDEEEEDEDDSEITMVEIKSDDVPDLTPVETSADKA